MRLGPGTRVGPYEVVANLGSGGMAEVYRARDSRLQREVALKVVAEAFGGDGAFLARLEHEARLAGSLNHPNVVAVYDVGSHEGAPYVVSELLQGETLRERLSRGQPPLSSALEWAVQMAQGLAAAHEHAIVHRDLKPENVFLTRSGHVKLLDFGIAKAALGSSSSHDLLEPTLAMTRTGVLGTPGYMSPEQVRGEAVDARSDIFSLGSIVHELLCGRRAFPGASVVESGHAILHDDPSPLPEGVPASVAQVVRRCLEKDPARRFQSAQDVGFALDAVRTASGGMPPLGAVRVRLGGRRRAVLGVVALGVLAAVVAAFVAGQQRESTNRTLPNVERVTLRWGSIGAGRFLPDGRVVFSAAFEGRPEELFVQPLGSPAAQSLGLQDVRLLAASRTGELAVLVHPKPGTWQRQGTLARVPSVGGTPREVAENVEDADWSPAGDLALVRQSGTSRILESPPGHPLFRTNGWISNPRFSAKGDLIAFWLHPSLFTDEGELAVTDLQGHLRTLSRRLSASMGLAWSSDSGEVWFTWGKFHRNVLTAVRLGGKARDLYRSLSPICLEDIGKDGEALINNVNPRSELLYAETADGSQTVLSWTDWNNAIAALSTDGNVLFSAATAPGFEGSQSEWQSAIMLRRTDGAPAQVLGEGTPLDLSPDGRWALVLSEDPRKLTALPTGVGQPRSIATHDLGITSARWMPDGKKVIVIGRAPGEDHSRLYRLTETASTPARVSDAPMSTRQILHISSDGRWAVAMDEDRQMVVISLQDGATRPVPHVGPEAIPRGWSPEGNLWVSERVLGAGARTRLLRLDSRTGQVLEERNIGPADPAGANPIKELALSPDGRKIAFGFVRQLGDLIIVRGLGRSEN